MDYGNGAAMRGIVEAYNQGARRTGRTTMMVNSLREGDIVVFHDSREMRRVDRMIRERGLHNVKCITVPADGPLDQLYGRKANGKTVFDHMWVEAHYRNAIKRAETELAYLERRLSIEPAVAQEA